MISQKFYIINFLFFTASLSVKPSQMCVCGHIQNQDTCLNSEICIWSSENCIIRPGLKYLKPQQIQTDCQFYGQEDCRLQLHCGFHLGNCINFEECKMFNKELCQDSSFQCVYDGQMCIQVKECNDYVTQIGCQNKNYKGKYCFWNTSEQIKCQNVSRCEDLPLYLSNYDQCSETNQECTVSDYGYGCTSKKEKCQEYKFEYQCFTTLNRQTCFWSSKKGLCLDKVCENFEFTTDSECKQQLEQCTTDGINCVIRKSCKEIKNQSGCIVDNQGIKCEYSQGQCQNKTCFTASKQINTYQQCQDYDFKLDCVLSENGGCKPRPTSCSEYVEVIDCLSLKSQDCIWVNNKCEQKQCYHAPIDYTHSDCRSFGNCIGKVGGGCEITPSDCNNISYKNFCEVVFSGQFCIWMNNQCVPLECNQLKLPDYKNHKTCQSGSPQCTFSSQFQTCADFTCENISEPEYCLTDSKGNECSLIQGCILKKCKTAPSTYQTNKQCEEWMPECTVQIYLNQSNKVFLGCRIKYSDCQFFFKEQCYSTIEGYKCRWNSAKDLCENDNCSNANIQEFKKNEDCTNFKVIGQICIIGNSGSGCTNWPTNCHDMKVEGQCKLNLQDGTQCFWTGTLCKIRECSDAPKTLYNTNIDCNTWFKDCIYDPTIGGCKLRPDNLECTSNPNIKMYDNHQKCNVWNPKCTVIDSFKSEGCIKKLSDCSKYKTKNSCKQTITGIYCQWDDMKQKCLIWDFNNDSIPDCQNRIYGDLSHEDCQSFLPQCTLNSISRSCLYNNQIDCSNFKEQQCVITALQQPCQWDYLKNVCKSVECNDNITATTDSECFKWRRNYECQLTINQNGSFGPGCENRPYYCQSVTNPTICNLTFTQYQQSCFYNQIQKQCQNLPDVQCEQLTFAKSNEECQYYNRNCILQQTGQNCVSFTNCSNLSRYTCGNSKMKSNTKCAYYSNQCRDNSKCEDLLAAYSTCQNIKNGFGNICYLKIQEQYYKYQYYTIYYCLPQTIDQILNFYSQQAQKRAEQCQKLSSNYFYNNNVCQKISSCQQLTMFGEDFCNSANLSEYNLCGFNSEKNVCESRKCEHLNFSVNPNITNENCFDWMNTCVLSDSGCVQFSRNDCAEIKLIFQCLQYSYCYWQTGACVNFIDCEANTTALTDYECLLISSNFCRLNYQYGQGCAYASCQVITKEIQCNSANTSDGQSCIWKSYCMSKVCSEYNDQNSCINKYETQTIQSKKVLIKCYWCNDQCVSNNACDPDIQNPPIKHSDCYNLNPQLTILVQYTTKCKLKQSSCSDYTYQAACVVTINGIKCYWNETDSLCFEYCKSKTTGPYDHQSCFSFHDQCMSFSNTECQQLDCSTLSNHMDCQEFPMKCFWNGANCQAVGTCNDFNSSTLCTQNSQGQPCFWNGTVCNEKNCSNTPSSTNCNDWLDHCIFDTNSSTCVEDCTQADYSYKSHEQCETFYPNKSCTIKPGLIQCVNLPLNCSLAKETQCFIDVMGNQCYYSKTLNQCIQLSCSILNYDTHFKCNQYLNTCTVNAALDGCQFLDQCNNYIIQQQCKIDILQQECEWIKNQNKCTLKNCTTAQLNIYSVNSCQQYFGQRCTVNKSFDGCVITSKICGQYSQKQCQNPGQQNYDGIPCFWDEERKMCLDQTCENGPSIVASDMECISYLKGCQKGGCRTKSCYDFYYPFDQACASLFEDKHCTTNGFQCVAREQCEDVSIIDGCTYDRYINPCVWINDQCLTKTCQTAPQTMKNMKNVNNIYKFAL